MKQFLASRWFLILLALVLVVGIGAWKQLNWMADSKLLRDVVVASVLFLMALPLEPRVILRTIRRPLAPALAILVSFGLMPPTAWLVARFLGAELGPGLLVAATTPCTMASAAVWTRKAGGNDAAATLVTLITNASCFLVTPAWLALLLGRQIDQGAVGFLESVLQLGKLVVLPMAAAQLFRRWRAVGEFATRRKGPLSVLAQCGILTMLLVGAVQTGRQLHLDGDDGPSWFAYLLMIAAVNAVHLSMLGTGWWLAGRFGVGRADQIAVAFAGSQKTLMVGLKVSLDLQVSILPMVAFHVAQLLVDTLIAERMAKTSALAALDPPSRTT